MPTPTRPLTPEEVSTLMKTDVYLEHAVSWLERQQPIPFGRCSGNPEIFVVTPVQYEKMSKAYGRRRKERH